MKGQNFITTIRENSKYGSNEYVIGTIRGIKFTIDGAIKANLSIVKRDDGTTDVTINCTKRKYIKFIRTVEKLYPGLCIFDVRVLL